MGTRLNKFKIDKMCKEKNIVKYGDKNIGTGLKELEVLRIL